MLLDLANSYVEALNTGSVPTIESAWDSVQLAEIDRSYRESLAFFEKQIHNQFRPPLVEVEEKAVLNHAKEEAIAMFKQQVLQLNNPRASDMLERLKKEIKGKAQQAKGKNLEITKQQCINALEQCIS